MENAIVSTPMRSDNPSWPIPSSGPVLNPGSGNCRENKPGIIKTITTGVYWWISTDTEIPDRDRQNMFPLMHGDYLMGSTMVISVTNYDVIP